VYCRIGARESGRRKRPARAEDTPDLVLDEPAMSTTNPSEQNSSDTTDAVGPDQGDVPTDHLDLPTDAQLLGVDGHGHTHLHSPRHDWVCVVTPAGDVEHEQAIGTRSVWDWVEHTAQCRGEWVSLRYQRGGFAENLVRTIIDATEDHE